MRVIAWNTEWSGPGSRGATWLATRNPQAADIVILAEVQKTLIDQWGGFSIDAGADWGYALQRPHDRKVVMWSPYQWLDVRTFDQGPTAGRLVMASTRTAAGPLTVVGVCVPWSMAHVSTGSGRAKPWDEHESFLRELRSLLEDVKKSGALILAGDFNQTLPRTRAPERVHQSLRE